MTVPADNPSPDYPTVFSTVMGAARATPATPRPPAMSDSLGEFIDACDSAIELAFNDPASADPLPGVDVPRAASVLKAYLLFLASERTFADSEVGAEAFERFYECLPAEVWRQLGFGNQPPAKMKLALAFSLIGQREHQAPELRGVIWLIGDLAASGLLAGVRA